MSRKQSHTPFFSLLLSLFTVLLLATSCAKAAGESDHLEPMAPVGENVPSTPIIDPNAEVRGVWIASVYNIDYPSSSGLSAEALAKELDAILAVCEESGLNTLFFQVRPCCDALYQSAIFPVSPYLSVDGALPFDPLRYLVSAAHEKNIFVHAWVNPLRVTVSGTDLSALPDGSPAKAHPDWVVPYADGKLYLNAGLAEVRQLVADGVREIAANYDVDGVVFDDYFYPYPVYDENGVMAPFDDAEEFAFYGGLFDNVGDWRRDNVNQMIQLCHDAVHEANPDCVFGVAPAGIWRNNDGQNGGSDTRGFEAYESLYCDATAWIKAGSIDFISPQIYWDFSSTPATAFDVVLRWWNSALDGTNVKLYVSHAAYKYGDESWAAPEGQLYEQVSFARSERSYRGSVFYGYSAIRQNIHSAMDDLKAAFQDEIIYTDVASNGLGVTISSPANGAVMTEATTYLIGMSDPYYPLTFNGHRIGRTKSGVFSLMVTLQPGENTFTFWQNGIPYTHTLTYQTTTATGSGTNGAVTLDSYQITNVYPTQKVTTGEGELWVSCVAPYPSSVTATIDGASYDLVLLSEPSARSETGYTGATYGKTIPLPKAYDGNLYDAGTVTFSATLNGEKATAEGARVRVMGKGAKVAVRVLNDETNLKFTETSSYYNDYTNQSAGMTDFIVAQRNGFYQLRMGGYVAQDAVVETSNFPSALTELPSVTVGLSADGSETEIRLLCKDQPAYYGKVEDGRFIVTFYNVNASTAAEPVISSNPLTGECEVIRLPDSNRVRYAFTLYDVRNFYGFDLRYENGYTVVTLRNPKVLPLESEKPLTGVTLVLDAGHGGSDSGAAGAVSGKWEKDVNLLVTMAAEAKLKELGATILLTRSDDVTVSLEERMAWLADWKPDLSISIHQNSMGYSTDITKVRGTLSLYCMDSGLLLAQCVGNEVASSLGRKLLGTNYQMLAMCRNPKFPEALVEVGFMTSAEEYEQMVTGRGIEQAADGVVNGILAYFEAQSEFAAKNPT